MKVMRYEAVTVVVLHVQDFRM